MLTNRLPWALALCVLASPAAAQFDGINSNQPIRDSHNCYPYGKLWANRIDRALGTGFPVAIEQDLAWYVNTRGEGRVVVTHTPKTTGTEPLLRDYFFERVRPTVEQALKDNNRESWPLIIVHFDFKDNQPALLHAVWKVLGEYQGWITTARKGENPAQLMPLDIKPLLVLTEDSDAQERVFFNEVRVGDLLRLFGSAHTSEKRSAAISPEELLSEHPTNYRRWWNNSWAIVEEGGQQKAGVWTEEDNARLKALVDYAHKLGFWIRFYTLDGFDAAHNQGWDKSYNFGSREAVEKRWRAALEAGVNLIATDQYEDLAEFAKRR